MLFWFINSTIAQPSHQTILIPPHSSEPVADTPPSLPNQTVYGYLPYWTTDPIDLSMSGLSHIAYFSAELNSDGTLSHTSRWENDAPILVSRAHAAGVKVHLCITAFSSMAIFDIERI